MPTYKLYGQGETVDSCGLSSSTLTRRDDILSAGPVLLSTTTIFTGPTSPIQVIKPTSAPVPIAAIAGGTAAGVILAISAVIVWTWWGHCIRRDQMKARKEMLSTLQVRENTRRNASSSLANVSASASLAPSAVSAGTHTRTIKFASRAPASIRSTTSTLRGTSESSHDNGRNSLEKVDSRPHTPTRRSPLHRVIVTSPSPPPVPPLPHFPVTTSSNKTTPGASTTDLSHKASSTTISSASFYSTFSGEERPLPAVPSSLIAAALEKPPPPSYLQTSKMLPTDEPSRLSHISSGSAGLVPSQSEDHPEIPIGLAS